MAKVIRFLKQNAFMIIGIVMLLIITGMALFAEQIAPIGPFKTDLTNRFSYRTDQHPLGTDFFGRDLLARILVGARYSLFIGIFSITLSMICGGILGMIAGYYPNSRYASIIIWFTDMAMAFPLLILGAMVAMMFGPGIGNTILALSIAFLPRFIRFARAQTLSVKEDLYILAAKSIGMGDMRIFLIHVIPNIISPILVMAVIWMSGAITVEVSLGFLGLGVPPPEPSWGNILQENLRMLIMHPSKVLWPCIAIAWTVQALNMIGDRFRDMLDPRMRT